VLAKRSFVDRLGASARVQNHKSGPQRERQHALQRIRGYELRASPAVFFEHDAALEAMPDEKEDIPPPAVVAFDRAPFQFPERAGGGPAEVHLLAQRREGVIQSRLFRVRVQLARSTDERLRRRDHAQNVDGRLVVDVDIFEVQRGGARKRSHPVAAKMDERLLVVHRFPGNVGELGRFHVQLDRQIGPCLLLGPFEGFPVERIDILLKKAVEKLRAHFLNVLEIRACDKIKNAASPRGCIDCGQQNRFLQRFELLPEVVWQCTEVAVYTHIIELRRHLVGTRRSADAEFQVHGTHISQHQRCLKSCQRDLSDRFSIPQNRKM